MSQPDPTAVPDRRASDTKQELEQRLEELQQDTAAVRARMARHWQRLREQVHGPDTESAEDQAG